MWKSLPLLIAGFVIALACVGGVESARSWTEPLPQKASYADLDPEEARTVEVVKRASHSVVFVTNKTRASSTSFFFPDDGTEMTQGQGSGFLWDTEGHVVTNYHVIFGATSVVVTLPNDHTTWEAEVVGVAPFKDLAVLKIEAPRDQLKPLEIGSSSNLMVGQKTLAIGNPFGLDQSLSMGVVSALGRKIKSLAGSTIDNVIQTDAAINRGNSGGPLLDSKGRLIGINTAIVSPSGTSAGIGFAVPVDTVSEVVPQLIEHGKVVRPGLGIRPLDDNYNRRFGIREGVIIDEVERRSAADRAGIEGLMMDEWGNYVLGDVIIGINEDPVTDFGSLVDALGRYRVGDTVTVQLLRGGSKKVEVEVKLQNIN